MGLSSKAIVGPVSLTSTATELHTVTVDGAVPVSVGWSATPTFNFNLGNLFKITLTGDTTPTFSNVGSNPRRTMFLIAQDATGGRAFTWPSGWTNMPPVTRTANAVTAVESLFDGTNAYPVQGGRLEVDSKTINADFFAGATYAPRVNAAIAYAVAHGYTAVRVSQPYDASAVTFNTGVHMLAEGARSDVIDVAGYGVAPGVSDPYFGIQAALDFANASASKKRVVFSDSSFSISPSRPLWLKGHGVSLHGPRDNFNTSAGVKLSPSYYAGPTVIVASDTATVPNIVTQLVTGTGNAWRITNNGGGIPTGWFNLRDSATCDLNGLSQFCCEFYYKSTNGDVSAIIMQSSGQLLGGDSGNTCFQFLVAFDGQFQFFLTTSGGNSGFLRGGGAIVAGTIYHVAGTYDGTTARLFVNGALAASSALTGTVLQHKSEDVVIGGGTITLPEISVSAPKDATLDSVRLSNTARYTAPFSAPTAKFTSDANTLALMNFATQLGQCTLVNTKNGDFWAYCRRPGNQDRIFGNEIEGLQIGNGTSCGIFVNGGSNSLRLDRVTFNTRYALLNYAGDSYFWDFTDIKVLSSSTAWRGVAMLGSAFAGTLRNFIAEGGVANIGSVPLILQSNTVWTGGYILAGPDTIFSALFVCQANPTSPPAIDGVQFSVETGVGSGWRGDVGTTLFGNVHSSGASLRNCILTTRTAPFVVGDSWDQLIFDTCDFSVLSGSPSGVLQRVGTPTSPAQFRNCRQLSTFIPWAITAGDAAVASIGKLSAIAFSTPLTIDCSLRDDIELAALTGPITINFSNVTPGQKISLWTVQNAGGGNAITFGTVNGTGAVKGATANDTTGLHYSQYLFDANLNGNLTMIGFSSGA